MQADFFFFYRIAFKNINFEELIKKNYENKRQLINTILIDEEIQKSVVISLLEESDATSWKLAKQISILEKKLAELTRIELSNKKREADYLMVNF